MEMDFAAWRDQARSLLLQGVPPEAASWGGDDLFGNAPTVEAPATSTITAPRAFIDLAQDAALHSDPTRFALLYRLLWRLQRERGLVEIACDEDVAALHARARAVRRDKHKMTAFVRFREITDEAGERFIAWYEPDHHIVPAIAPFFVDRFTNMRWSILTPEASMHWDGEALAVGPGARRGDAPAEDAREEDWRVYYSSIFNPARLNLSAMQREMPKKRWRNLPEASLIAPLTRSAEARTSDMVRAEPTQAKTRVGAAHAALARGEQDDVAARREAPASLSEIAAALDHCRACPLWRDATQGVPGEGPSSADIVFVGEQPGDQEDLQGKPFVGPAGQVFNRALAQAGIDRKHVYVTNSVKHFKHEPRGKKRLHKRPNVGEIEACRWWLSHELKLIKPKLVVALGATAARSVLNHTGALAAVRGKISASAEGFDALVTIHPSALLRTPDENEREIAYRAFVADLKKAAAHALLERAPPD
jgi:probable DNA metabolism protein